jgi:hypothetical protein
MSFIHNQRAFKLGLALFAAIFSTLFAAPGLTAPRTPTQDSSVIERLPFRAGDSRARALAEMRANVLKAPDDAAASVTLAQAYFDLALALGDPRYVGYADAIVARFGSKMTPDLLITRGMLQQYRHEFAGALTDFAAAKSIDPDLAITHAWRGAIYLVQAKYSDAGQECAALLQMQRAVLYGGCTGLLQAYTGQLASGYAALEQALATTRDDDRRRWLLTRLGEVAAWQGQSAKAERHYRDAVALGQDDGYLLAAWADFLLDKQRPAEVVKLLATWEASDGLLLRLAEAEAQLKLPAAAAHIQALDDRFAAAKLRGDTTHQAEEARFQLRLRNNPALSLQVAMANYQVQKEPRDVRILLEAALAAKSAEGAKPALDWLQTSRFEDAHLQSLAKQIAQLPLSSKKSESKP